VRGPSLVGKPYAVAARTAGDVWAVGGRTGSNEFSRGRAFALHWNGRIWRLSPGPALGVGTSALMDVAPVSLREAWAVGFSRRSTVIERWDGRRWRMLPAARTPGSLFGVAALSARDVWAVGATATADDVGYGNRGRALVLHWDGRRWRDVAGPPFGPLLGVAVAGRSLFVISGSRVARREGSGWVVLPSARPLDYDAGSIVGRSARDVWAAGGSVMRWDGSRWGVPLPSRPDVVSYSAVAVGGQGSAWAVGFGGGPGDFTWTRADLWDGERWRPVPTPYGGDRESLDELTDVAAVPGRAAAWAVGSRDVERAGTGGPILARSVCRSNA
jgi:hypothetical protein